MPDQTKNLLGALVGFFGGSGVIFYLFKYILRGKDDDIKALKTATSSQQTAIAVLKTRVEELEKRLDKKKI